MGLMLSRVSAWVAAGCLHLDRSPSPTPNFLMAGATVRTHEPLPRRLDTPARRPWHKESSDQKRDLDPLITL